MTESGGEEINKTSANVLDLIQSAFSHRAPPKEMTDSKQLSGSEYAEVMSFEGLKWQEVCVSHIEQAPDAVFWLSPEAFCYYLPGVLTAGIRAGRSDLLYFDSLIGCLDRSPEPDYWNDFFYPRFTLLSAAKTDAVAAWAHWMELVEPEGYHEVTYQRVQRTLELLRQRVATGPSK